MSLKRRIEDLEVRHQETRFRVLYPGDERLIEGQTIDEWRASHPDVNLVVLNVRYEDD